MINNENPIQKALSDDFDGVLFCVLTKLKHAKIVVFKITSEVLKCSNEIKAR